MCKKCQRLRQIYACFCRKEGSSGKVELSVRYQEHSQEQDLLSKIKEQVVT